jgi:DNA polymerase (family 10)
MNIPLAQADKFSAAIVAAIEPWCERIVVAGSIRRRCSIVHDIDIVVLPKPGMHEKICARCRQKAISVNSAGECNLTIILATGIQLDVFFATPRMQDLAGTIPSTWGTVLLCRTGSKEFNQSFAMKAQEKGLHWNPYRGLIFKGAVIAAEEEADMFKALKMDFVPPEKRIG